MSDYTMAEEFELPSKGLIYAKKINPRVKLRSMTTQEEMKRLAPTETPYKAMCGIIEDCMVGKPPMPVYDMCLGDYQFLLHKLRIVTYGKEYKMTARCPFCGNVFSTTADLDDLKTLEYDESVPALMSVKLPACGKTIGLRMQTPRSLDDIALRKKEIMKKSEGAADDPGLALTLAYLIESVDGVERNPVELDNFVRRLPMKDANVLIQTAEKLNRKVGVDTALEVKCSRCGQAVPVTFRITGEFFGPSID